MVTHDLHSLYTVCDRVAALADGKIVAVGPMQALLASEHPWVKSYFQGERGRALAHAPELRLIDGNPRALRLHRIVRARRDRRGLRLRLLAAQHGWADGAQRLSGALREHRVGTAYGAAVLFNGIRVGEVTGLRLDPDEPRQVVATIAVQPDTPMRADTHVGLDFQGLTGVPVVALEGRATRRPPGRRQVRRVCSPRIRSAGQSMTHAARDTLRRVDSVLAENAEPLRKTIANLNTFSAALARNSDRLDAIVTGVERMVGGGPATAPPIVYDLRRRANSRPTSRHPPGCSPFWSRRRRSFSRRGKSWSGRAGAKTDIRQREMERQRAQTAPGEDHPELRECRLVALGDPAERRHSPPIISSRSTFAAFSLRWSGEPVADVEFVAKLLTKEGQIVDERIFHVRAPARATDAAAAAAALNEAFGKAAVELVVWTTAAL